MQLLWLDLVGLSFSKTITMLSRKEELISPDLNECIKPIE